ncbi:MAG TPA: cyclic nucleotide-binding domain-containing protein [Candidatus Binataceae bacterium]|nr:cyclic nucleotide-binding domain-containing protein [Candidatus Binataceae bacterium]
MEDLSRIIRSHPFVHGLDDAKIKFLTGCAANVRFGADKFLVREGSDANASFLIRSGRVVLEIDVPGRGAKQIQTVEEGEVLGWSWLYPPYRWQFDARAVTPVRAIQFDGACLRNKCEADHDLGYEIVKRLLYLVHQRLERTRLQLLDVYRSDR